MQIKNLKFFHFQFSLVVTSNNIVSSVLLFVELGDGVVVIVVVVVVVDRTLSMIKAARCRVLLKIGSSAFRIACRQCIRQTNALLLLLVVAVVVVVVVGQTVNDILRVFKANSLLLS